MAGLCEGGNESPGSLKANVWLRIAVVTAAMLIVHTGVPATPSIKCPTITGNETVPHPVNCSQYYMCVYGKPELMLCPAGLHFSVKLNDCDDPDDANCDKHCDALVDDVGGTWTPSPCTTEASNVGTTCNLNCNTNFTLSGSASVQCTENGWNSSNGNALPKCITLQCLSNQIVGQMNKTLSKEAGLLFVLDESGSIGSGDFQKSKAFVNDIISRFPLSATRSAGVITFDSNPIVRIPLRETSTSNFQATVSNLPYRGGGTKVREAMEEAIAEIARHRVHPLTLVRHYCKIMEVIDALDITDISAVAAVKSLPSEQLLEDILFIDSNLKIVSLLESSKLQLSEALNIVDKVSQTVIQNNNSLISEKVKFLITDGQTETDATEPCNRIKAAKNPIFTIAVKDSKLHYVESLASLGDNGIKHFFHTRDFGILKSIGQYINQSPILSPLNHVPFLLTHPVFELREERAVLEAMLPEC
ncbi:hypothetical protein ANN_01474 [Periplaneta americana]|uniref:Uncharacterized protein n=1 Tax=Periplaneta americana TaxID=6978 RepID=A0ABQ8TVF3_PERAM|nr:hypothetical protein ANN_01474 [Periplaneta americana]